MNSRNGFSCSFSNLWIAEYASKTPIRENHNGRNSINSLETYSPIHQIRAFPAIHKNNMALYYFKTNAMIIFNLRYLLTFIALSNITIFLAIH
jgi:hypothetical protein